VTSTSTKREWSRRNLQSFSARLAILFCCCATLFASAQDLPSLDVLAGKALFDKNWVSAPASTAASDGLGPFFNARSCMECHRDGGRGDSAAMLSFVTADPVYGEFLQTRAIQGLRAEGQVKVAYRDRVVQLPDGTGIVLHTPEYAVHDLQYGPLTQPLGARIAPSLLGTGLLAQVAEQYLQSLADPDDSNGDGISGRISKVRQAGSDVLVTGRFGWKAATGSLAVQAAKAFSLDMGLGTALFPSPFGDCTQSQHDCLQQAAGNSPGRTDPEVSETVMKLLLTYLQSLAPAKPLDSESATETSQAPEARQWDSHINTKTTQLPEGAELFGRIGCSACHLPAIPAGASLISPFTDLLLHDMGPDLAAETNGFATALEWRTAPLWGLGSAQSYLHDGRAKTLAEAILWHGGEASAAVKAYSELPAVERDVLHSWLHRL
jgi:CxxC motif-containing protein (DUF1111 family)